MTGLAVRSVAYLWAMVSEEMVCCGRTVNKGVRAGCIGALGECEELSIGSYPDTWTLERDMGNMENVLLLSGCVPWCAWLIGLMWRISGLGKGAGLRNICVLG